MIGTLHRLRRDEDGQTLVLAAVAMLVLALCVMATVNISQATYQKVRLQNAADATAYSVANLEAEGFNFFAYSNRAVLCQYASMMTLMAYDSFLLYFDHTFVRILKGLSYILDIIGVGEVLQAIAEVLDTIVEIVDMVVAILVAVISALNWVYFFIQSAMLLVMTAALANTGQMLSANDDIATLNGTGDLAALLNAGMLIKTVDIKAISKPLSMSNKVKGNEARKVMTDIVNTTRHPWVAGTKEDLKILGRIWKISIGPIGIPHVADLYGEVAKQARTEDAMMAGGDAKRHDELYSVDALKFEIDTSILGATIKIGFTYITEVYADLKKGGIREGMVDAAGHLITLNNPFGAQFVYCSAPKLNVAADGVCAGVNAVFKVVSAPFSAAVAALFEGLSKEDDQFPHYYLGIAPYMKFRPDASSKDAFDQPDFLVIANASDKQLDKFVEKVNPDKGKVIEGWSVKGDTSKYKTKEGTDSQVDFHVKKGSSNSLGSKIGSFLAPGFMAVANARTYYHRPGDWREQPNFFNPFWGARLEPIAEHPALSEFGLDKEVRAILLH